MIPCTFTIFKLLKLYRLIYLDDPNAGAETLAEVLKAHLEFDGLWDYIKDNLVGLVTDGDAVS